MTEMGGVDRRFARAIEDTPTPSLDSSDRRISYQHYAMEFINDSVIGYVQVEKSPGYGHPDDVPPSYETHVLGRLEGEEFEAIEDPEERREVEEKLGLNKGAVRFLDGGVPEPGDRI